MSSKAVTTILALMICVIAIAGTINTAGATLKNQDIITTVQNNNARFAEILNAKDDPEVLMEFLHNKVDHAAKIEMSINNPDINDAGPIKVNLGKADYINSYLYGPRQVKNYQASIKTVKIDVASDKQTVQTQEVMTESGIMLNPHDFQDEGRPFTSYTNCESEHNVSDKGEVTLKSSKCHTDILYEEAV